MWPEQVDNSFAVFYREQAPAVFDLAMRHGGDQDMAADCVDVVFAQLADHWRRVRDPVRFIRRTAVLFICESRRRGGRPLGRRPALSR
jgi:DNA-directed RNA polymerase specialized sigma24 family protein